jgi:thiamine kinase-like enzyme
MHVHKFRRGASSMNKNNQLEIPPPEITSAFYGENYKEAYPYAGGLINKTYLVANRDDELSMLQRLNPIFDKSMANDYDVVSKHLAQDGWEVAIPRRTTNDEIYIEDDSKNLWRSFSYIYSDKNSSTGDDFVAFSGLLGALHKSLSRLNYKPQFSLPHFHDTPYYASELRNKLNELPNSSTRLLARLMIVLSTSQGSTHPYPEQLIHGDPKQDNALFREQKPFTFIDFDTLMRASPLIDVGDMMRSITSKLVSLEKPETTEDLSPIIHSYYGETETKNLRQTFTKDALLASQTIALELGMRFLIDLNGDYFSWDPENFNSRREHMLHRAETQLVIHDALAEQRKNV